MDTSDVHRRYEGGVTALHQAAESGTAKAVEQLLSLGARNWITDDRGRTALDLARERQPSPDRDRIIVLLGSIRIDDPNFRAAVAAIDSGDVATLKSILREHPTLVHQRAEEEGWFAGPYFRHPMLLHFVANNPNRSQTMPANILVAAQTIIDAGARVDTRTESDNGGTTLGLVATSQPARVSDVQIPLIELLVRNGADPNEGIDGAMNHREIAAVTALLRLGARHTLLSAAGLGDIEAMREMLAGGAMREQQSAAAQVAAVFGRIDSISMLLEAGLDVNVRLPHPYGPTVLHQAAWFGHAALVEYLLQHGADGTLRDTQFQGSPADWAHHAGHSDLAARLRSTSSDA